MKKELLSFWAGAILCFMGTNSILAQQWWYKASATYENASGAIQSIDVYYGIDTYRNDISGKDEGAVTKILFRSKPEVPEGKAIRIELPNGRVEIFNSMDDADNHVVANHHTITGIRKLSANLYDNLPRENFPPLYDLVISPSIQNIQARFQDVNGTQIRALTIQSTNLKEIPDVMCHNCSKFTSLTFADNCKVGRIGKFAFNSCNLTNLTIPTDIALIDNEAFEWNRELTRVTFKDRSAGSSAPEMIIDTLAFAQCAKLSSVTFGHGVRVIGMASFNQSPFKERIEFPEGLEEIHYTAFGSVKIVGDLILPNSLTFLGHQPWGVNTVDEPNWIFYNGIHIPENLQHIGNFSFMGSRKVQENLVIPRSVAQLGANCFATVPLTGSITIPSTVTSMGNGVFLNCGGLEYIIFEANTKISIGERQFRGCTNLKYVDMSKINSPELLASLKTVKVKRLETTSPFSAMLDYTLVYLPENLTYETKNDFMAANQVNFVMKTADGNYRADNFRAIDNSADYQQFFLLPKVKEQMRNNAETKAELEKLESLYPYAARGCDYKILYPFTADKASYERTFTSNSLNLYTISLPYGGASLPVGLKAYKLVCSIDLAGSLNGKGAWFVSLDDDRLKSKTESEKEGKLEGNHPYVLCFENTDLFSTYKFDATNVKVESVDNIDTPTDASQWRFVNTNTNVYNEKASASRFYTLSGSNKKWNPIVGGDPNSFFHSFRGALKYLGEGQPQNIPLFLDDNQATGIGSGIDAVLPATTAIYTIDGYLVNDSFENLAPGLYIINGEKVVKP